MIKVQVEDGDPSKRRRALPLGRQNERTKERKETVDGGRTDRHGGNMAWPSAAADKTTRPSSANVGSLQAAFDRPNCGEALGKALSLWGGWTTQGRDSQD